MLAACSGGGVPEPEGANPASAVEPTAFTVHNKCLSPLAVDLSINGRRVFQRDADILDELDETLPDSSDQTFAVSLWRLIVRDRYHFNPFDGQQWAHSPTLFFNSFGFCVCDDTAAVYAELARLAGRSARVWGLEGHVVPEILIAGRWQMFDPDLETYYLGRDGSVQGVQDLMADTRLITQPEPITRPTWAKKFGLHAERPRDKPPLPLDPHGDEVAAFYGSTRDNRVSTWYDHIPRPASEPAIVLPPRARLLLGDAPTAGLLSMYGDAVPQFATLTLVVPPGWHQPIALPFVPVGVQGAGEVLIGDEAFVLRSEQLSRRLAQRHRPIHALTIRRSTGDVAIEYLLNATRFAAGGISDVRVTGAALGAVSVERRTARLRET